MGMREINRLAGRKCKERYVCMLCVVMQFGDKEIYVLEYNFYIP